MSATVMGNRSLLGRQLKRHMGNQQKQNQLPKGQISKKVSVKHCFNSRQAHCKSFAAPKSFLYSAPLTPQPLLIHLYVCCAPNHCRKENECFAGCEYICRIQQGQLYMYGLPVLSFKCCWLLCKWHFKSQGCYLLTQKAQVSTGCLVHSFWGFK